MNPPTPKPVAERPPPPKVSAPMLGEPSVATLSEARLVESSCEDVKIIEKKRTDALVAKMKQDVDASFQRWSKQQPGCWEQYRYEAKMRAQWGQVGSAIGYGSLGLSGVGSGGGGFGRLHGSHKVVSARSVSRTNNQVSGVDEADIVKTDGRWVYFAMNGALRIVEAMKPRVVSVTRLRGHTRELFVDGDRAVVFSSSAAPARRCTYGYDCQFAGDGSATEISVFDISSRAKPKLLRSIELSGSLIAARKIGHTVHTVVADGDTPRASYSTWPSGLATCGTQEKYVRAKFAALKRENEKRIRARHFGLPTLKESGNEQKLCRGLLRTAFSDGEAFTTLVSFDVTKSDTPTTATIQSRPGAVFASTDALYFSVGHRRTDRWYSFYDAENEVSEIHKFRIGGAPEDTRYVGSGVVPGHVLNQFSMDEWYGYLRIATTKGHVPDPKAESVVSVLAEAEGGNLARVGAIPKIAPGEDIRAVRFDGDRAYVVTFKKTDPLFVMDLYDPARPKILGELKIPGFSTYLHRIDPEHLLSIGFDAEDHDSFAYFDGVILQLFDVKNPTEPKLLHKEKIGTRGSSSEAITNHLAFNYLADKGLLAVPMTICEGGGDGMNGNELTFGGLLVYDVSVAKGFKRLGGIDHGTQGADCSTWWSNATSQVKRSLFLDDLVYSIANDRVKVQRMGHFGEDVADIRLN